MLCLSFIAASGINMSNVNVTTFHLFRLPAQKLKNVWVIAHSCILYLKKQKKNPFLEHPVHWDKMSARYLYSVLFISLQFHQKSKSYCIFLFGNADSLERFSVRFFLATQDVLEVGMMTATENV